MEIITSVFCDFFMTWHDKYLTCWGWSTRDHPLRIKHGYKRQPMSIVDPLIPPAIIHKNLYSWFAYTGLSDPVQYIPWWCRLGSFCGGIYVFQIYICVGYMLQTILGVYVSWIYILVLDTHYLESLLERLGVHFQKYGYMPPTIWGENFVIRYIMPTVGGWM